MEKIRLGKTNLMVSRSGFGALPAQRVTFDEAAALFNRAIDAGINFIDTATGYTDSEEKIGYAVSNRRNDFYIATKTPAVVPDVFWKNLELSLTRMKTDHIDVYQYHNPKTLPNDDMVGCMVRAKEQGKILHIGITNHRRDVALAAAQSGVYETLQYPLSALSDDSDLEVIRICKENNVGVIAMKALSGGLLNSAAPSMAIFRQYDNVIPIWGFQRLSEVDEVITLEKNPPALDEKMLEVIAKAREELSGSFCRGCGYCMPCPVGIQISECARMPQLLRRGVWQSFTNERWQDEFKKVANCLNCGKCISKCPYELNTQELLKIAEADFWAFCKEKELVG
ncbi:aldo/keto reductase [Clostridia bacterium]|nr:aldo/keto reductase [Clostridia bacterium]